METSPLWLVLALLAGVLLAAIWAAFVVWVLYAVATRPELKRDRDARARGQPWSN